MYSVTQQFRTLLTSGAIQHIRGTITLVNGDTITLTDDNVKRPSVSKQCTSDADSMGIGQLYTGTIELTLLGETDLQRELLRGGTIFALDHRIPNGVSIETYRYYVALGREMLGLPPHEEPGWARMAF